jgi:hypothetical protein
MIIAVNKILMNRLLQSAVSNTALDTGEILLTEDTARVIVGPSSLHGTPYRSRTEFPYSNMEVLTEGTIKNDMLFGRFVRNLDERDQYLPSVISNGVGFTNITAAAHDGELAANLLLEGDSVSSVIEYYASADDFSTVRSGVLRILASSNGITVADTPANGGVADDSVLSFDVVPAIGGFAVLANNAGGSPITMRLRQTTIGLIGS